MRSENASANILGQYQELAKRLQVEYPASVQAAFELSEKVINPERATADQIWQTLWNKPIFANNKVELAENKLEVIKPYLLEAWKSMGEGQGPFSIRRIGPGFKTTSYDVTGQVAKLLVEEHKLAPHRLLAIVNAGRALHQRTLTNDFPFCDLTRRSLTENVEMLRREFGFGWGAITILHWLTDLGLACKPDLHLVRSVRSLGIAGSNFRSGVPTTKDAILISEAVATLANQLKKYSPSTTLRHVDKMLMEFSFRGMLPN